MVVLDGSSLSLSDVVDVARNGSRVSLCPDARARMVRSHDWVAAAASGALKDAAGDAMPVYGVNTGYGSLARKRIEQHQIQTLSWNLIRSHAAGVGPELSGEIVRGMMLLRANALAKGASGCRAELVERLIDMLNIGVTPVVPSRGSCGSSGDLAPLCHLGLVVFRGPDGEQPESSGHAWFQGERVTGAEAMARAGLKRLIPGPKEGLAMSNGAQLTCSLGVLACVDAEALVLTAEIAAAMSWDALQGVTRALHPGVHALRPYPGAIDNAANLRALLADSELCDSLPDKVQDAYSIRCTPQILGSVRDGLRYAGGQIGIEVNAVTDNPVMLLDADGCNKAYSAGLFHGEPLGLALDHLKLGLIELAAVSERRIYRLTTGNLSVRLPPLLAEKEGLGLGLMMPQVTAAALVGQCRQLAYPASADSIPTCEDQEDHVAMSTTAARRCQDVLTCAQQVVALELWSAARALQLRKEQGHGLAGKGSEAALAWVQEQLDGLAPGHTPAQAIERLVRGLRGGSLLERVTEVVELKGVLA